MYRDKGNIVIEEDEECYGEELELIDKKSPSRKVPYSDVIN
jgi:hypothetical protein